MDHAALVITRNMRTLYMRRRLKEQYIAFEKSALELADQHMLECDKVLTLDRFVEHAENKAVEKVRLCRMLVQRKSVVRRLFLEFTTFGLSDVKKVQQHHAHTLRPMSPSRLRIHPSIYLCVYRTARFIHPTRQAFHMSKLQWVNFCTEAEICKAERDKIKLFGKVFKQCMTGTADFLPPNLKHIDNHMVLCEFVEGLVRVAELSYPSKRGRTSESFQELAESNLFPLVQKMELAAVASGRHDWDELKVYLEVEQELLLEIFTHFSSLDEFDEDGEAMNVCEFMRMIDDLSLCDEHLSLSQCIEIFQRCNQEEVNDFLGPAVDGYGMEERKREMKLSLNP